MDFLLIGSILVCCWVVLNIVGNERRRQLRDLEYAQAIQRQRREQQAAETVTSVR